MTSAQVREHLVDALRLDTVGPDPVRDLGDPEEVLVQSPSRWYLTGFLVPWDAGENQRAEETSTDELDAADEAGGADDATAPEQAAARRAYLPSSLGLSFLVPPTLKTLTLTARWGDYRLLKPDDGHGSGAQWQRVPHEQEITLPLPLSTAEPLTREVPDSTGLQIVVSVRPVPSTSPVAKLPQGTRSVAAFLVNRRPPAPDEVRDTAFAFQAQLEVVGDTPFIARPNLRDPGEQDWEERVADLHYRDTYECAVGHGIATEAVLTEGCCRTIRTCWIPQATVERVAPTDLPGVELAMFALSRLADTTEVEGKLCGIISQYRAWLERQQQTIQSETALRRETAQELLQRAEYIAKRIERGIHSLQDPLCLEAFRLTNRAMALAAQQRQGVMKGLDPQTVQPRWRPFQLAFLLMNLPGIADPLHADRETVDLLFFPTGGGKTEAYLGLAAFTLLLRRLKNPGLASAGVTVLMRYTLRLLTLDQLGRAATLICALELERQQDVEKLGEWPFEIGLWVGRAATPNRMGARGETDRESARAKTIAFKNDDRKPAPIPLEDCPWCGAKFTSNSFQLLPHPDHPTDLRITCASRQCAFNRGRYLPVLAVDEPIYRRLPCFLIATVDKFAAMPWTGAVGAFFGRVQRHDADGFYGPCAPAQGRPLPVERLLPPDLIIQDELHLISGPLGTMAGLYEIALDELASRDVNGRTVRPKVIASTATVRRAEKQINALFSRRVVDIFPPPGPDRRDSFFAIVHTPAQSQPRWYVGLAAQGRSPKVVMLRTYLALLAAAQKLYQELGGKKTAANPGDPYMTLLGYFNSLRELGGARRLVEDEVGNRLMGYGNRRRHGETEGRYANRKIAYEVVELTSRVSTDKVAEAKQRLQQPFGAKDHVDVAIATNMISVGLDITRLGLMVVFGQPKTSAEYIQATSRVGRDLDKPGLVVVLLNIHRPRDRSHYERFAAYHETFYRSVEATSVTPFSPRALDRGLAGILVALARQGHAALTPPLGAGAILTERPRLEFVLQALEKRAEAYAVGQPGDAENLRHKVRLRAQDLLDDWSKIAHDYQQSNTSLQYNQAEAGAARPLLYHFLDPELKKLPLRHAKFRANRSLRDVEPSVNLWLKTLDEREVEDDDA